MIFEESLAYLAEKSGVPVWLLDENAEIRFTTVKEERIGTKDNLRKFFSIFSAENSDKPQIKKFETNELYGNFSFEDGHRFTLVAGPAYEIHPFSGGGKGTSNILFNADSVKEELLMMPVVTLTEFCRIISVLAQIITRRLYAPEELEKDLERHFLRDLINRQLAETIFEIREEERETAYAPASEKKILSYVTNGDVQAVQNFKMPKIKDPNAKDTRYQNLFEGVALVTLATRAAMDGGLDYVEAFSLSDLYFRRLSGASNDREIADIVSQLLPHFAQKVKDANDRGKKKISSPYILQSVQYIRSHLHSPLRLEDVAQEVGLEPKYFSRLFVTLTGEKFSSFVQRERVMEAKTLLENTNRTIIDVSNSLGFSSQSYFIKVFNRYTGETPGEFLEKKKRYRGADRV